MKTYIRWMISRDMAEVLEIERLSFEYPWSEDEFKKTLRTRNCIGMVAVDTKTYAVVGYMVYELAKNSIRLLNFAVAGHARKRGVGRMLMAKLTGKLSPQRRSRVSADVRERNLDAQLFMRACGFVATCVKRDFYEETQEDAFHFVYRHPAKGLAVAQAAGETH